MTGTMIGPDGTETSPTGNLFYDAVTFMKQIGLSE
jgi:hypothetical protein